MISALLPIALSPPAARPRPRHRLSWALVLFLAAAGLGTAPAQESLVGLQRELERVQRDTDREKELHKAERKRASDFEAQKAGKLKALQDQLAYHQSRSDSLKRLLERARQQKKLFGAQGAAFAGRREEFAKSLASRCRELAKRMESDFPHERERRRADLEDIAVALENRSATLEDGLGRLFAVLQGAIDLGHGSEVFAGPYRSTDGKEYFGSYLRLGAVMLVFSTPDAKTAAYLVKEGPAYAWRDQGLDPMTRQRINSAVRIAEGKEAPELARLPVPLPGGAEKRAAEAPAAAATGSAPAASSLAEAP